MKKGIKTLKEYLEFVKDEEVTGGTIMSMDDEIFLIEVIKSAIEEHEAQLKAKDAEIALLKQCVEEAIKRPMGVEPSLYSDYKMLKDKK